MPSEYEQDDVKKKYDEIDGMKPSYSDKVVKLYEFHTSLDLKNFEDENGIKIPYIVTIEDGSNKVVGIRRNFEKGDDKNEETIFCSL